MLTSLFNPGVPPAAMDRSDPSETSLLRRVAQGEVTAMEACIDRYGGLVHSIARRLLPSPEDIEEAVQDVFADLWRHADRFDPTRSSEKTLVATIARRRIIDRRRRGVRRPDSDPVPMVEVAGGEAPARAVEAADELERVRRVIDGLEPDHRRALRLSVFEGWPHAKIAEELQWPLGTVKARIRRGLLQVRETLGSALSKEGGPS